MYYRFYPKTSAHAEIEINSEFNKCSTIACFAVYKHIIITIS